MEEGEATSDAAARPWQSYHSVYTNAKAGMDGVDKEKVQKIVYEMSKGSRYFEHEERKEALMKQKIENMRALCSKLTPSDLSHYQKVAGKRIIELEVTRDLSRIWLHVDMDAFYAAVETLSNPSLQGKPMAVGGMSMICTANYEARKFGVRAAMPGFIARKLCPDLIFVPTDFKKYTHYSDMTRKVFQNYDSNFIAASLDEAYLDITDTCKERGVTGAEIAEEMRSRVYEETGLTCSAGVAPNRLLAKVCSDINKPNGQFVLPNERMAVITFISSLPIRKIGGIGKVTEHILRDVFGINTCEQMLQKGGFLCALFSQSSADFFLSVGLGLGSTHTPEARMRKSISNERTFPATENKDIIYNKLADLAEALATDMQKEGLHGRTLTLKLKTASFEVRSRAVTLQRYISSVEDILNQATKLLKSELPISVRLMGIRMSHFQEDEASSESDHRQKSLKSYYLLPENCLRDCIQSPEKLVSLACGSVDEGNTSDMMNLFANSNGGEGTQLEEKDSLVCSLFETSGFVQEEADFLIGANIEEISWVDGYQCSLCGYELPPGFIEERQEHSDFHIAEKLQQEESRHASPIQLLPNKRIGQRDQTTKQSSRKKSKSKLSTKGGNHLPIDTFFTKNKQNP